MAVTLTAYNSSGSITIPQSNFLSGSTIFNPIDILYNIFSSNQVYLGFARGFLPWGRCTLIKLNNIKNLTYPGQIMAINNPSIPTNYFWDNNSSLVNSTVPTGSNIVYLAKIPISIDTYNNPISQYTFIPSTEVGNLQLQYMNQHYALVTGFNPNFTITDYNTYNYYLFNYGMSTASIMQVSQIDQNLFPSTNIQGYLASGNNPNTPNTILTQAGILTKTTNILGETVISGLNPTFQITANPNIYYFFTDLNGNPIISGMTYVETIQNSQEYSLVFQYTSTLNVVTSLKVSTTTGLNGLAIFNESLPNAQYQTQVSDANPPGLSSYYLRDPLIYKSIFDIKGIAQIPPSAISFGQLIQNETQYNYFNSNPSIFTIQTFTVTQGTQTTNIQYATTQNKDVALSNNFTNIVINMQLPSQIPTNQIYRQLFICYQPKDNLGNLCTYSSYTFNNLFNLTTYDYSLGNLLYIANKFPVNRNYLVGNENFTIIL